MISIIKKLFPEKIIAKAEISLPENRMEEIKKDNRKTLDLVDNWIDEEAFSKSFFQYGVPQFIKSEINKSVGNSLTYSDLMVYLSSKHFPKLKYFEIGVSVGKNIFQLMHARQDGHFTGFDIEEINPVLGKRFSLINKEEWKTPVKSIKKNSSTLSAYRFGGATLNYVSADVWDENSWAKLKGNKFNMVFSDALHTPQAILFEFEMLVKYELLDERFIIFWDDLVGKMKNSFYKIIRKYDRQYKIQDIYLLNINGWVGENEEAHSVGIISNFNL